MDRCTNCNALLTGAFCAECGQRARGTDVTFRELATEAFEAITSLDGAVWRSFWGLLARPGVVTREYLSGKRAQYLPPLRMYLLCSLAFVLASALKGKIRGDDWSPLDITTNVQRDDGTVVTLRGDAARKYLDTATVEKDGESSFVARLVNQAVRDPVGFKRRFREAVPRAVFALVPAFALLLWIGFRSRKKNYPFHLVVALHVHAAGYLLLAMARLASTPPLVSDGLDTVALLAAIALALVTFARVYGGSARRVVLTSIAILIPYAALVVAAMVGVFGVAASG